MKVNLRTRIGELDRLMAGHQREQAEGRKLGRTRAATSTLSRLSDQAEALVTAARELAELGSTTAADLSVVAGAFDDAAAATREDGLYAGRDGDPAVLEVLRRALDELSARLSGIWRDHKLEHTPPGIDPELLSLAGKRDPGLTYRVDAAMEEYQRLRTSVLPAKGDGQLLLDTVARIRGLAQVAAEEAPTPSVIAFVRAAASPDGASVTMLDSKEVLGWLLDADRASRFVIRLAEG